MIDDLKKLIKSQVLLSLDRTIMPRLLSLTYWTGLAAIVLLAINHLFASFALGFGAGLWGILEIVVFGLLAFFVIRLSLELAALHFAKNGIAKEPDVHGESGPSLLEEVRGAIEDLAKDDVSPSTPLEVGKIAAKPATTTKAAASKPVAKRPRRTAKRTTAAKTSKTTTK